MQCFEALHEVEEVELFGLLDHRIDHVDLAPQGDLFADEVNDPYPVVFGAMNGKDIFPARRQFVNHRDIEVPVQGHGEGAGDRRGRHNEDMGWAIAPVFLPETGALCHAEPVLFVNDSQAEALKGHVVFQQGMGSDQDMDGTGCEVFENGFARFPFDAAREESDPQGGTTEIGLYSLQVLLGQDFGRRHEGGLEAVVEGDEHRQEGDHRFSAAYIALEQAVHLCPAAEVPADLPDDPLLGTGQLERHALAVEIVELFPYAFEYEAADLCPAAAFHGEEAKLQKKELLELQAVPGGLQLFGVAREMDRLQGVAAGREAECLHEGQG